MIERLEATVDHVLTCQTQALKIGRSLAPNHQYYRVGAPGLSGAPRRHAKVLSTVYSCITRHVESHLLVERAARCQLPQLQNEDVGGAGGGCEEGGRGRRRWP